MAVLNLLGASSRFRIVLKVEWLRTIASVRDIFRYNPTRIKVSANLSQCGDCM